MNDLIAAAKSAIDILDRAEDPDDLGIRAMEVIADLRAAVERAEKQEAVGFDEYWRHESFRWDKNLKRDVQAVWTAAQQAERERILDIIHDNRDVFSEGGFCLIVEKIDATTE